MKTKKLLLFLFIISSLLVSACNGGMEIPSQWVMKPIMVDGNFDDWNDLRTTYFEEEQVVLGLANDNSNLYVQFRFRDPQWMRTIKMSGLTIWFNTKGNKDKTFMIRYKGGPSPEEMRFLEKERRGGSFPEPDRDSAGMFDRMPQESQDEFVCYVKDRIIEKSIHTDGSSGPAVAYGSEQGFYVYEFSIPLKEGEVRYYGLGTEPGEVLGIGLIWGGMSRGNFKSGAPDGFGGPGGMGGGPGSGPPGGGGFPGGGRGGGPGGKRPDMPKEQEVWLKVPLAVVESGN